MRWELRERTTSDVSRDAMETGKKLSILEGPGRHEGQLLEKEGQDQTLVDLRDKLNLWDATHTTREGH